MFGFKLQIFNKATIMSKLTKFFWAFIVHW